MSWFTRKCVVNVPGRQLGCPRGTESELGCRGGAQRGQQCAGSLMRGHAAMAERADSRMCVKCVGAVIQSHNASVGRDWESAKNGCDCEHHYPSCGVGLLSLSCIWYTICVKILDVYCP